MSAKQERHTFIFLILVIIMALRISSYFTLFPNSVALTQVVKTGLRVLLTGISAGMLWIFRMKGPEHRYSYQNFFALGFYIMYLFLGLISLYWTSSVQYSTLQLAMIVEAMFFAWFYYKALITYNMISGDHAPFSKIFGIATLLCMLGFLIGLAVDPSTFYRQTHGGEVSRLGGFIINPNELGMLAVLGAVMAYAELLKRTDWVLNIVIWIACVLVLLLTQSRSSLGAFVLVSGIAVLLSKNRMLQVGSIVMGAIALPIAFQKIIVKAGDLEEVMSMTGRLPFWKDLIADGFTRAPLLGYGFQRISHTDYFDSIHAYAAKMTHNTFIQVLLNLGLVGMFIVILQMIATTYAVLRSKNYELKLLALLMLIPLIINSMTEFGIFGESNYGIQFYQLLIMFFMVDCTRKETTKLRSLQTAI